MVVLEFQGVETDYCPTCSGVWLDRGELGLILQQSLDFEPAHARVERPGARRCPHCTRRMRVTRMPGSALEVDRCPRDHGIWFDAGELRAVIEARAEQDRVRALARYCEEVFGGVAAGAEAPKPRAN